MTQALNITPEVAVSTLNELIDLDRYPIHDPDSEVTRALIAQCRAELDAVGCCCIANFVRPQSIARMQAEIERKRPDIYWSQDSHNPYMRQDDPSLPEGHPKRAFQRRSSGFVNSDILEEDSDLRRLYDREELLQFVSECLGVTRPIYRWSDPLGCSPYSVMDDGNYFPWHFDGNEFTVSILVQQADKGGVFEYCPDLRTPENENFDQVADVLKGDCGPVHTLDLKPGDLQIFKGRFSMHRVTPVEGSRPRYIALPTYVYDPETVNRPERAKQFYGRAMPIHYEREALRPDTLTD
uniref:HalD/BesD family halogenase n=1 Tax=Marinobacterium profundum TaxID=1714300 RepID=UPI0008305555|nr:hypothetical protein [Marinobacterium profundum]